MNKNIEKIEGLVNEEISQRSVDNQKTESILYSIPYKSLPITTPSSRNELSLIIKDVIVTLKEQSDGKKVFELYTQDGEKLAESNADGRMSFERAIEDLIDDQIRKIKEAGYEPAGIDDNGNIDTIFEMLGRQLVVLNEEQKERLDRSNERIPTLRDISDENMDSEVEKDEDIDPNTVEGEKQVKNQMQQDLAREGIDIEVSKIAKIDSSDSVFWENNPDIKTRDAFVVLTKSGEVRIVGENNGEFKAVDGFENPTNEAGRTTIIRNDEDDLSDNTKNTYGSIQSTRNADMRYTVELGQYGEIKLVEQRKIHGGSIEESDKYISREVQTNNTNFLDRNLEGHDNSNNITERTFRANSVNRDASYYGKSNGKGGISEVGNVMKNHKDPKDFTMETLAADESLRIAEAERLVEEELENRGILLNSDEKEKIEEKITAYIGNSEHIFCKDDAVQYANEIQIERRNEQNKEEKDDEDLSRLDMIAEARENRNRK